MTNVAQWISIAAPVFCLGFGLRLLPDALRIIRRRPVRDPVTVNGFARYMADFGEHWKKKPRPWIYVVVTLFFLLAGAYGTIGFIVVMVVDAFAQ